MNTVWRVLLGLGIALAGALLAKLLSFPLPWLLGPLLATAATRMIGIPSLCPRKVRYAGQWVIGLSLGLYFTPEVARHVADHVGFILIAVVYALLLGIVGSQALYRFAGLDFRTAWFSAAIGGASEMTSQAERHGARADHVASAHSLRVLLVVVIIPFSFQWWLGTPPSSASEISIASAQVISPSALATLAAFLFGTCLTAWVFRKLSIPSAWVLGPMAFTIVLNLQDQLPIAALPSWVSMAGQVMIGWSLGERYRPDFFRAAPRLLFVVGIMTVSMLIVSAMVAYVMARFSGASTPAMILGMAPGGIAEMTITAKVLGLGVPLVTAMQVIRMIAVVLLTAPLYRLMQSKINARDSVK